MPEKTTTFALEQAIERKAFPAPAQPSPVPTPIRSGLETLGPGARPVQR
jgi:hypothetical protein